MTKPGKKVMLVTPPYHCGVVESAGTWMPVAFVYLAGSLRNEGHEVRIYDAMSMFHTHEQIEDNIRQFAPDVVATTAITATFLDAVEVLATAKRVDPKTVTIIGNVHPTFMWEESLKNHSDAIDFIVMQEGEVTLPDLLDTLGSGGDLSQVDGIAYMKHGKPNTNQPRALIQDLDSLPRAWDLLEWGLYSYRPMPRSVLAVVSTSRGCEQACTFCSQQKFWKQCWRANSPEAVVDELHYLHTEYGVNVAMLSDETPTVDQGRWLKILTLLEERGAKIKILMETRVDHILRDEEHLPLYRKAGVDHIYVGVESPNQDSIDVFKKDIKVEDSRRAIELINNNEMVSECSFVLGMPDDTQDKIRRVVDLATHYAPDMAFFLAIAPWPYSDIYDELKPYVTTTNYRRYNLVEPVLKPKAMTIEELNDELDRAHQVFFMDRMKKLKDMSAEKRNFMLAVFHLLVHHSYLGDKMKAMMKKAGPETPPEMREMLKGMNSTGHPN